MSASNKQWIGPVQILGQLFRLTDDSFGLERGLLVNSYVGLFVFIHSSTQHAWKTSPRITYTMKSSSLHTLDSDQRLLTDEACCYSDSMLSFGTPLLDVGVNSLFIVWNQKGKEQNKYLESITKTQERN